MFVVCIPLILFDPLNFFQIFSNVARAQLFALSFILFFMELILFICDNDVKNIWNNKTRKVITIISFAPFVLSFILFYKITIPDDINKKVLSHNEFLNIMASYDYKVKSIKKIEKFNLYNSEVYFAEGNNILIYYIVSDKVQTARKIADDIYISYNKPGGAGVLSRTIESDDPDFYVSVSRIKNSVIYIKTQMKYKVEADTMLRILLDNNIDYDDELFLRNKEKYDN